MWRRLALVIGALLVVVAFAVFAPALARRDTAHYRWAGTFGEGVLGEPIGIAYAAGRLFVTDASNNRIVVFDTSGAVLAEWDDSSLGLRRPMHLSVGLDQLLRVAEYLSDRVTIIDSTGAVVARVGGTTGSAPGELDAPGGVAVLGDALFVAEFYNHRVQLFSAGGTGVIGRPGRAFKTRLHYPTDVAVGDSLVYVADAYNHRIQVFRHNGEYVRKWGGPLGMGVPGSLKGWFDVATGLAVAEGKVYVADFHNNRIQVFTVQGRYLGQVADSLSLPTDVAIGRHGGLYVVDFGHKRVVRFALISPNPLGLRDSTAQ
jgi:DNA-binding beta-propeller fold protein YncE